MTQNNSSRNDASKRWLCPLIQIWFMAIVVCAGAQTEAPLTQATYFSYRLQHLNQALHPTPAQEDQIKQVVQQESGMLNEVVCNLASSRKDQLHRFDTILRQSDASLKPILTAEQNQKLPELRESEMRHLKSLKPPSTCTDAFWTLGE
jgi:hypothetical protein